MPAPAPAPRPRSTSYLARSLSPSSVSMKDLLASCASAAAVSTPPCAPSAKDAEAGDLESLREREQRPDAARERDAA
ncbi:hypothetical protein ACFV9P_07320 [Streptomyces sp. NPDC059892]|uniref:hypothetical protein n=1 Tax=Streptomyces sp. NPDC059892 TaxID=3346989 RepID=UPI003665C4AD